ncbi:DNA-processing protein DprA [Hippea maritima]|uniref:DNA protecting protein DprA n=1 Tax=Hippea maritima (strain ATCC 700847 / DSM 10411 / MH2) TaxID=760142 RepID=F2LVN7_HIPMA|nr:DNA-processing protein DprA [Hippea maritima]AEA33821.1 DNA protecting protein DprA [Hippea maritima DSM 10411]
MEKNELKILLSGTNIKDPLSFGSLEALYDKLKSRLKPRNLSKELAYLERNKIQVISVFDDNYPERLKEIEYPPVILYVKGNLKDMILPIAIVGSRYPSGYGERVVKHIVPQLIESGFEVVSGLARGIDALSHKITLGCGGYTVGVLGCGIDIIYPKENKPLFDKMSQEGCIITEFPLGTPPAKYNFPARNRIIVGLSEAVLVVEADIKSGSLITARLAAEQSKTVFAVPGEIFSKRSMGTNKLISEGAIPVLDVNTILGHFYLKLKEEAEKTESEVELSPLEKEVLNAMEGDITEDEIALKINRDIGEVSEVLFDLHLKGVVRLMPNGSYQKN